MYFNLNFFSNILDEYVNEPLLLCFHVWWFYCGFSI